MKGLKFRTQKVSKKTATFPKSAGRVAVSNKTESLGLEASATKLLAHFLLLL